MNKTFFAPAPAGLNAEQLAARAQREHDSNNAIATLMSNGPAPSPEALALMQRHVDGELSIEQVIKLTDEMLLARYSGQGKTKKDTGLDSRNTSGTGVDPGSSIGKNMDSQGTSGRDTGGKDMSGQDQGSQAVEARQ